MRVPQFVARAFVIKLVIMIVIGIMAIFEAMIMILIVIIKKLMISISLIMI